jgi:oligoendopeptidase F
VEDVENKMFYFDYENVWNKLQEIFSLSSEEIKKITKQWVNKELGLKRYRTYLYR